MIAPRLGHLAGNGEIVRRRVPFTTARRYTVLVAYPAREWTIAACFIAVRARLAGEGGLLALGIVFARPGREAAASPRWGRRREGWRYVRKPCRIQDLPRHLLIDMRRDFAVKRIGERVVFESAGWRAVWRQISVLGQIGKRHRVGAVGQAHEIVKAFFRLAVVTGKAR